MTETKHYQTAPEDRVLFSQKVVYGLGSLANNLLGAAVGMMAIVLNLGLGMNPALVGWLMSIPRFFDAFTDPVMGYISDHTKSRWGRRRPYIFIGAIFSGIIFALMWQLRAGQTESFYFWFFLSGCLLFYLAYTIFATPWVALGYELTPDYHERTRLMGYSNFIGQFAWVVVPWFYAIMQNKRLFADEVAGARGLAIGVGIFVIVVGVLPAIFLRERYKFIAEGKEKGARQKGDLWKGLLNNITQFFKGFLITIKFPPFLKLCTATFLVFNGFMAVAAFSSYVIIYYVFGGDKGMGAQYMGWFGTVSSISTFCVIYFITWLSTKIGKRNAFFVSTGVSIIGYALKWICYNPDHPNWLLIPAPLIAFGLGGLFTLMGSMMADVCDFDELNTGHRREGMYGSIFWWVVKLGMTVAFALSGYLLNATGFDVKLGGDQAVSTLFYMRVFDIGVPIVTSAIAILAIATYKLTESKAHEVRLELEKRRGKVA